MNEFLDAIFALVTPNRGVQYVGYICWILHNADDNGTLVITWKSISKAWDCSIRQARFAIENLVADGVLETTPNRKNFVITVDPNVLFELKQKTKVAFKLAFKVAGKTDSQAPDNEDTLSKQKTKVAFKLAFKVAGKTEENDILKESVSNIDDVENEENKELKQSQENEKNEIESENENCQITSSFPTLSPVPSYTPIITPLNLNKCLFKESEGRFSFSGLDLVKTMENTDNFAPDLILTPETQEVCKPKDLTFDYAGDQKIHGVTDELRKEWQIHCPDVNINNAIRDAEFWLQNNPEHRKKNIRKFVYNWLSKCQSNADGRINGFNPRRLPAVTYAQRHTEGI